MGCCFSSSSGGPDKEIDEIALPEVFPYRVGGVNLDHSYSDRPWYKRFDLICPIIVILLFVLLVSWALISSKTSFPGSKPPEIASGTYQTIGPNEFVAKLRKDKIKLVVFDMDGTATSVSQGGRVQTKNPNGVRGSDELKAYVGGATQDFKEIVPILLNDGFNVAIATFSDEAFMLDAKDIGTDMLAGKLLVDELLKHSFPNNSELRNSIAVVAQYTPDQHKDPHIKKLCLDLGLKPWQAVLFDDRDRNVKAAKDMYANAYHVDGGHGFSYRHFFPASHDVDLQYYQPKAYANIQAEAQDFITKLRKAGIKLVLFDMDRTATSAHAGGCLTTESKDIYNSRKLKNYVARASVHFKYIVPILLDKKFDVAIVTFSDTKHYERPKENKKYPRGKRSLAGEDLVKAFLKRVFPGFGGLEEIRMFGRFAGRGSEDVYWYPELGSNERNKNTHIAKMCGEFGVHPSKAVLFDDQSDNVVGANDHTEATAYRVTGRHGFEFRYF
eukprot:878934_1